MGGSKNYNYCRINGTIHNLSDVKSAIDNEEVWKIPTILKEYHEISEKEANTFLDFLGFTGWEIPSDYNEALKRMQDRNQAQVQRMVANKPKCPTCNSTNISKIGFGERATSVVGLGLFSKKINKTFKCNNCKYTW